MKRYRPYPRLVFSIPVAALLSIGFFSGCTTAPHTGPASESNALTNELPSLHWSRLAHDGQLPVTALFQPPRDPWTHQQIAPVIPIYSTTFPPGGQYQAALGPEIRREGAFASLNFSGVANDDPNLGTVITIDGASLRYEPNHNGSPRFVRMMASNCAADGHIQWVTLPILVWINPGMQVHRGPRIALRFHPAVRTYDVYTNDAISLRGLALPPVASSQPVITVSPGQTDRPVVIRSLLIGHVPADSGFNPSVDREGNLIHRREDSPQSQAGQASRP